LEGQTWLAGSDWKEELGRFLKPFLDLLSQLCPPCATPFSNFSLDYRRSDARIVENRFAASSRVSNSAKVVLTKSVMSVLVDREVSFRLPITSFEQADPHFVRVNSPYFKNRWME
jgi:hypothetical protein